MRNLAQYPVTYEEKVKLLEDLHFQFLSEGLIGDMRPLLLVRIREDLEQLQAVESEAEDWL